MTTKQGESINTSATIQFPDGDERKIVKGTIIDDQDGFIIVQCEHAKYFLNKNMVDWIKYG